MCGMLFFLCAYLARGRRTEIRAIYFHLRLTSLLIRGSITQQLHQKHLFKLPGRLTGRIS
jgi:hypothetical protein